VILCATNSYVSVREYCCSFCLVTAQATVFLNWDCSAVIACGTASVPDIVTIYIISRCVLIRILASNDSPRVAECYAQLYPDISGYILMLENGYKGKLPWVMIDRRTGSLELHIGYNTYQAGKSGLLLTVRASSSKYLASNRQSMWVCKLCEYCTKLTHPLDASVVCSESSLRCTSAESCSNKLLEVFC
jgi:hypothetical protein